MNSSDADAIMSSLFAKVTVSIPTPDGRQSKTLIISANVDHISSEIEFSIEIGRPTADKWQ